VLRDLQLRVQQSAPALSLMVPPQQSPVVQFSPPLQMPAFVPQQQFMPQQFVPQQQQQFIPQQLQFPWQPDTTPAATSQKKRRARKPRAAAEALPASPAVLPAAPAAPAAVRCAMAAQPAAQQPATQPATQRVSALNAAPLIGGPAHVGPATPSEMRAFTIANPGRGGGMCFDFYRRGICHRGEQCRFQHA